MMLDQLRAVAKAIAAGLASGTASLVTAMPDGVSSIEWVLVGAAVLGTGLLVWAVPNAPLPPPYQKP